jgi:hypothetical protein
MNIYYVHFSEKDSAATFILPFKGSGEQGRSAGWTDEPSLRAVIVVDFVGADFFVGKNRTAAGGRILRQTHRTVGLPDVHLDWLGAAFAYSVGFAVGFALGCGP